MHSPLQRQLQETTVVERLQSLAQDLIEAGNEHFRIGAQPARVLFWTADTNGACELVSNNWENQTGQRTDEAVGSGWLEAIIEEDRSKVVDAVRCATGGQRGFFLHYRLRRPDRGWRWVLHDAAARFLPSGKFNGLLATITDRADASAGELATERAAQQVFEFLDGIPLAAVAMGFDGRIMHCNQVLSTLFGRSVSELIDQYWIDGHVHADDRSRVAALIDGAIAPSALPPEMEYHVETRSGGRLFRWHLTLIRDFSGHPLSIAMLGSDITQWRRMGNQQRLTAQMFDSSHEAMVITDSRNNIVSVNEAFTALTGYSSAEAIGRNPRILKSGRHDAEFYRRMWKSLVEQGFWRGDVWDRRKDGSMYPKFLAITAMRGEKNAIVNFSAIFYDVTERKALEEKLDYLAHYDPLTGLPNRMLLQDRLEQSIAAAERQRQKFALLFIDLDGFKSINDSHGHNVGDELLKQVGQRLLKVVRRMDTAARLGGDEFVVILTDVRNGTNAGRVAEKLVASLSKPFACSEQSVSISASIGVSIYPNDELVANELLRTADEALYKAKRDGKRRVRFYGNLS
jgi:diguanylate cyclase (GGDEF)-like protein/PAS domain S-box-containing protein